MISLYLNIFLLYLSILPFLSPFFIHSFCLNNFLNFEQKSCVNNAITKLHFILLCIILFSPHDPDVKLL